MSNYEMADIHMHIIPRVDDGSLSMDMSQYMLAIASMQGVRTIFATPHSFAFIYNDVQVWETYKLLKEEVRKSPLDQRMFLGCEVRCEPENMETTLRYLHSGRFPSMNGTKYVLTEFCTRVQPLEAMKLIDQLKSAGWLPIIAHIERYPDLFTDDMPDKMWDAGCLFQMNAYSLESEADRTISERARRLLAGKKVSFLGSDAHRLNHRPPSVKEGLRYLYKHCDKEYADAVAFGNAERYLIRAEVG